MKSVKQPAGCLTAAPGGRPSAAANASFPPPRPPPRGAAFGSLPHVFHNNHGRAAFDRPLRLLPTPPPLPREAAFGRPPLRGRPLVDPSSPPLPPLPRQAAFGRPPPTLKGAASGRPLFPTPPAPPSRGAPHVSSPRVDATPNSQLIPYCYRF